MTTQGDEPDNVTKEPLVAVTKACTETRQAACRCFGV
jgi:hypothetical protein